MFLFGAEIDEVTDQGHMVKGKLSLERLDRDTISLKDKVKLDTIGTLESKFNPLGFNRPKEEPDKELERLPF